MCFGIMCVALVLNIKHQLCIDLFTEVPACSGVSVFQVRVHRMSCAMLLPQSLSPAQMVRRFTSGMTLRVLACCQNQQVPDAQLVSVSHWPLKLPKPLRRLYFPI